MWVALKIVRADLTTTSREIQTLQALAEHGPLKSKHIIKLLDHFQHDGPNGRHQCLVFELCGPNLQYFHERWYGANSNPKWALPMMKHILEGLAFIHEAGFVHGGI
jgi:serine/threonine-protein kinase SRPK3